MINNYNLEIYLSTHFGKNIKEITSEEMASLENISLDGINIEGLYEKINFEEVLRPFPNLKEIVINNYVFSNDDIISITNGNIKSFSFYKCDFTNANNFNRFDNSKEFLIERCIFNDYEFLYDGFSNLEVLCITNPADEEEIDISRLSCLNVIELFLERCIITNCNALVNFEGLEFANLLNTQVSKDDLVNIVKSSSLKNIFVSQKYVDEEVKKMFEEKGINLKYNVNEFLLDEYDDEI